MNSLRGSTPSPISTGRFLHLDGVNIHIHLQKLRVSGSIVVSQSCFEFISPRPYSAGSPRLARFLPGIPGSASSVYQVFIFTSPCRLIKRRLRGIHMSVLDQRASSSGRRTSAARSRCELPSTSASAHADNFIGTAASTSKSSLMPAPNAVIMALISAFASARGR